MGVKHSIDEDDLICNSRAIERGGGEGSGHVVIPGVTGGLPLSGASLYCYNEFYSELRMQVKFLQIPVLCHKSQQMRIYVPDNIN